MKPNRYPVGTRITLDSGETVEVSSFAEYGAITLYAFAASGLSLTDREIKLNTQRQWER